MNLKKLLSILIAMVILLSLTAGLAGCAAGMLHLPARSTGRADRVDDEDPPDGDMIYRVQVKSNAGTPIEKVGVYVYEDETLAELVWFNKTGAEGEMSFSAPYSDQYVVLLSDVPTGYAVQEQYPVTGEVTQIELGAGVMEEEDLESLSYEVGDLMMDFTVIDTEGNEITMSQLLAQKKIVLINFFFTTCGPCANEFPYLQEVYEMYKEDVAVIAMDPLDDAQTVTAFRKTKGLTFPMASVPYEWSQAFNIIGYPTTVVIDRDGVIRMIEVGAVTGAEDFVGMFEEYIAD